MHADKLLVEVALDADLVSRARRVSANLDGTIEMLLRSHLAGEESGAAAEKALIDQWIKNSNAFIEQHGSPADEHIPF